MAPRTSIVIFGDQTEDPWVLIKDLSRRSQHSPAAQKFLQCSSDALRDEVFKLPQHESAAFESFHSIVDLADKYAQSGVLNIAVSTILHCVAHLGNLIIRIEKNSNGPDAEITKSIFLGSCTGLIAAATAATVHSVGDLLHVGPEILCFSLRLGLEARRRSMEIESSSDSWATTVFHVPKEDIRAEIDSLNSSRPQPRCSMAYISAVFDDAFTISGPPATLERLFSSSSKLSLARKAKLSIPAAFHASHLARSEVPKFTEPTSTLQDFWTKQCPVYSTSTGKVWLSMNLVDLLENAVIDVLYRTLNWTETIQNVTQHLDDQSVEVVSIGSSNAARTVQLTLEQTGKDVLVSKNVEQTIFSDSQRSCSQDIAITGMSGRFPGAEDLDQFWELLLAGRDMHQQVPADRFDVDSHVSSSGKPKNTSLTPYGCFIERLGFFDARLFNMSPREASQTDPGQRLLLLTAYEALEMAGYSPNGSPSFHDDRVGTFFGQTTDDWREHNASQNIDIYYVTGGIRAFGPGRLNYHFKWSGPSYSFDTACSSSSVAIQKARSALLSRECDTAVAGGANILTGSDMFAGLSRGGFLSTTGSCRSFGDDADGYCRADGAGCLVMKRLEDAIADGDNVQAILRGAGTNHSANATSITHPHARTQESLYHQVLRDAAVDAEEIGYVEMHGTGTQAGDSTEYASVANELAKGRSQGNPLHIGAVKANLGHSEAAAGITSVIKAILMMREKIIPPHIGARNGANKNLQSSSAKKLRIPQSQIPFEEGKGPGGARKVLVNNFSAAGGNTSLLLQEPPSPGSKGEDPRNPFAILVSAKTRKSLADNLTRLVNYLHKHPDTNLADLAYTTSARRMHHDHRHAFVVNDVPETVKSLIKARTNAGNNTPPQKSKNDQIAFVFSGQGSQYTGMGGQLFVFCSVFREKILECEKLCLDFGFPSIIHFIQGASSSDDMVFSPMQTQLALVSLEIAMAMLWQSWGIHPRLVIGHSLGEYAALNVSGVIPLASTLYLVGKRAQLMQKSCTPNSHSMLVAQETLERVHHHIQQSGAKDCKVSCVNGPRNIVISATNKHICELERYLGTKNVRTTFLEVPYAFHSSQMNPLLDEIKVIAEGVHFSPPKIPFASTVEGRVIEHDKMLWSTYVKQQTRHPVLMSDAVSACQELGFNEDAMWIECGPGSACLKMIKAVLGTPNSCLLASLDTREKGWMTICKSICKAYERGLTISWKDFHRDYRDCLRLLELPSYSFDLENHWIQYNGRWSLTKGDEPPVDSAPAVFTTCLQRLVSSKTKDNHFHAVFESWLADPGLKGLISGHRVHGFDLCPASVFTEMALSAAFHVHSQGGNPEMVTIPALELRDMQIFNPLVLNPRSTSQKAEIIGIQDLDTGIISIEISSQDGSEITQHARCKVHFGDAEAWRGEWLRSRHFIDDARARLVKSVNTNKSQKLLRGMVYKIFNSLVDYAQEFQSLEEVVMDDRLHEATAMIKLRETSIDHDCIHNPYWIDCLAQLGGFVLNGSAAASPDNVHLAHGWESLRLSGRLSPQKQYTCHVRMMPVSKGVMVGDVYLLDQDAAVATCYGLKFQEMKRHVLHSLLSPIAAKGQARQDSTRSRREDVFLQGEAEFPRYQNGSSLPTESPSTELPDMPTPASTDQDTHVSNQIAIIIAEEIGIDRHDLSDDTVFAEMGLDSLLSISILARLKAETGQILSSSFFTDHPKLEDARRSLGESLPQREKCSGSPKPRSTATPNRSTLPSTKIDTNLYEKIAVIIAEEIGIDRDDISDGTMLAEIGLDSLLAISILTRLREDTGQLLSSSFFNDHPNLEDVRQSLGERPPQREASSASPKPAELNPQGLKQGADGKAASANEHPEPIICPTVHLQGIRSPSPALFLLPEGAGTARMYAEIPDISPTRAVVGIDSPFYSCPEDYQISFEAVASCFVRTIRSIQPYGPYIIGGYSVGGIYAYEVSRQLLSAGEAVQNLIMIDSPCPGVLPPMPAPLLPILEKTGLFESLVTKGRRMPEKMPEITKRHVQQCIAAMEQWSPTFMSSSSGRPERVDVIWGQGLVLECMSKEQRKISDEGWARETGVVTKSKDWFYGIRDGFGPEGWDHLLGASNVICHVVDGHHFSMMKAPQVAAIGTILSTIL